MDFNTNLSNWQPNVRRCLQEQWTHITKLLNELPDEEHLNYEDLSSRQQFVVQAIDCIEEEWIVDPQQRAQLSVLEFDDD